MTCSIQQLPAPGPPYPASFFHYVFCKDMLDSDMFSLNMERFSGAEITITNIKGKRIANRKSKGQIETFDLKPYANGIYLITILHKKEIYNLKVMKD